MRIKDTRKFGRRRFVLKMDTKTLGDREHWKASEIKSLILYEISKLKSDGYEIKATKHNQGKDTKIWALPL